ncbi:MAG: hypothetical protein JNL97_00085 [Verrucomicrobiales bacterium]|nr:hypothetical protein [Verrucomicrobiales bacterium]
MKTIRHDTMVTQFTPEGRRRTVDRARGAGRKYGAFLTAALLAPAVTSSVAGGVPAASASRAGTSTVATLASPSATSSASASNASSSSVSRANGSGTRFQSSTDLANAAASTLLGGHPNLAITVNRGLEGLSEDVIPALADPDVFGFDDLHFLDDERISCFVASVGVRSMQLEAPVTRRSVVGSFGNDGKVFVDIDLDAVFEGQFYWDIETAEGFNACDIVGAIDNAADFVVGFFGGETPGSRTPEDVSEERLDLTASGLVAEVDLTLKLDDDAVKIKTVDKLTAEIGALSVDGTALVEGLAILAQGVVTLAVGDVTDAVNTVINDFVLPEQQKRLKKLANTALDQNLHIQRSVAAGSFAATIEVDPVALKSSRSANTMTLEYALDVVPLASANPCGASLSFLADMHGVAPQATSSDFDIHLPLWMLAKIFAEAGHQGLFCQSTLMPFSTQPWTVRPEGALSVENARTTETVVGSSGLPMSVVHHMGEVVLVVPLVFEGDGRTYTGRASGDLKVYLKPVIPPGQRLVHVDVTDIEVADVVGTLSLVRGGTVDLSGVLNTFLNSAADILAANIGNIPLIPKTTAFSEEFGIEIHAVSVNDSYLTVGANIVVLPPVSEDDGGFELVPVGQGTPRYPDEDEIPGFDSGIRDRIDPVP